MPPRTQEGGQGTEKESPWFSKLKARRVSPNPTMKDLREQCFYKAPKLKFDTFKLSICTMYILLCQFVVFFTYTTDFMPTARLSFPDCLKGDTHLAWIAAAPPRDVISIRAAIRRDLERIGEGRAPWLREFAASAQYLGSPQYLLEAAV